MILFVLLWTADRQKRRLRAIPACLLPTEPFLSFVLGEDGFELTIGYYITFSRKNQYIAQTYCYILKK
jgi:hypothetical protein